MENVSGDDSENVAMADSHTPGWSATRFAGERRLRGASKGGERKLTGWLGPAGNASVSVFSFSFWFLFDSTDWMSLRRFIGRWTVDQGASFGRGLGYSARFQRSPCAASGQKCIGTFGLPVIKLNSVIWDTWFGDFWLLRVI